MWESKGVEREVWGNVCGKGGQEVGRQYVKMSVRSFENDRIEVMKL
jgi:hypothetical protein